MTKGHVALKNPFISYKWSCNKDNLNSNLICNTNTGLNLPTFLYSRANCCKLFNVRACQIPHRRRTLKRQQYEHRDTMSLPVSEFISKSEVGVASPGTQFLSIPQVHEQMLRLKLGLDPCLHLLITCNYSSLVYPAVDGYKAMDAKGFKKLHQRKEYTVC